MFMFKRFEIFLRAYELRNFTEVAHALYLSQPTVSVQLKKLEEELLVPLFIREGPKEVIPTKEADFLYGQLLSLRDEWVYTTEQLQNIQTKNEVCVIACSNTCATNFVPKIFKQLQMKFSTLRFEIRQVNSEEVMELMEKHKAHIGFIEKPLMHDVFERFPIFEDELVLAGETDAEMWMMREQESGITYYNKRYLEENNIHLPIIEVTSNAVIVAFLKEGIGKTILSKELLPEEIHWNEKSSYKRYFYCVTRKHPTTSVINQLNDFVKEQYEIKVEKQEEPRR